MKYNFAKLLQDGGQIRKYLTAAGGGIKYKSPMGDTWNDVEGWRTDTNSSYDLIEENMIADPNFNMEEFNDFLRKYYDLTRAAGYIKGKGAIYHPGTHAYQKEFDLRGYHTSAFKNGWKHVDTTYNTGDNFDVNNNWAGGDEVYGWTTANRYVNSFNEEELARKNKIMAKRGMIWVPDERAEGIDTGDGRKFYKLLKIEQPPIVPPPGTPPATPPQEEPRKSYTAIDFQTQPNRLKLPWTDWLPLSLMEANDLMVIERNAALKKKLRFPLEETPFFQHKVTNNYNLRAGMQQKANELRDLAAFRSNSSDLNQNMENMHKYDTSASEIELLAELEKAKKFAEETKIAENVANTNTETGVKVANNNMKQNAAAWNNILEANIERNMRRNQSINSYIGNMYTSHGEWLKDMRINDSEYLKGLNQINANQKIQEYNDQLNKIYNDYKNSNAYQQFVNEFTAGGDDSTFDSDAFSKDPEGYLKNSWYGDSEIAKKYQALYELEKVDAYNEFLKKYQLVNNQLAAANLMIPSRVNNQGVYYNIFANGTYNPNISPAFRKQGGRLGSRFADYQEHVNRELRDVRRGQHKRNELSVKKLDKDLDRLSKEQLILLRQIFK